MFFYDFDYYLRTRLLADEERMKYFAIEYPNHTTLLVKDEHKLERVLIEISNASGVRWHGAIYNPQSFLSLREVETPDDRQKLIAKELSQVLIG